MVLVQVLDPLPLLEHTGFDTIPLSRVVNSEVNQESVPETYPSRLLVQESPHPISNCGGIPHRPRRSIKSTIPRPRINNPMTKKLVQDPLISGQLLPLWAQLRVKPSQSDQGLVPDDVIQRTPCCPQRTGRPLIGMVSRCDDLQEQLDSLPRREQPHLPAAESNMCRDHHCTSPEVAFRPELPRHGYRSQTCES